MPNKRFVCDALRPRASRHSSWPIYARYRARISWLWISIRLIRGSAAYQAPEADSLLKIYFQRHAAYPQPRYVAMKFERMILWLF